MANSHFIKTRIEPLMRAELAKICGVPFLEREMPIRWKGEGTGVFRFDAVSEDCSIVASLSTARNLKSGQRAKLMRDATFMWLIPKVARRILAVVEASVAAALNVELKRGRLPPGTEIVVVNLARELREEIDKFRTLAAKEVGANEDVE